MNRNGDKSDKVSTQNKLKKILVHPYGIDLNSLFNIVIIITRSAASLFLFYLVSI